MGLCWWYFTRKYDTLESNAKGGEKSVLKTELEVVKIGKSDIATLPEGEQRAFFETLYARVLELAKENNNKD